jgi:hypothetical protein
MCKTVVSSVDDPMARGLNWGILLLFAMPFSLVGAFGGGFYLARRARDRRERA